MDKYKDKSKNDLLKELEASREAVRQFRFSIAGSGKRNVKDMRSRKKETAGILTELKRRELETSKK